MSYPDYSYGRGPHRWFDGGPRRLWGLLMTGAALVAGMFLGRFLTQSEMHAAIALLETDLADRDAEIGQLRHEASQLRQQQHEYDHLSVQHERLLAEHRQTMARMAAHEQGAAAQQQVISRTIAVIDNDQRRCLSEIEQFGQSMPVDRVRRFADVLFDARRQELESLMAGWSSSENLQGVAALHAGTRAAAGPAFVATVASGRDSAIPAESFFGPPPQRRAGYTFCPPRESTRMAETQRSRMVFSDKRDDLGGPVRR